MRLRKYFLCVLFTFLGLQRTCTGNPILIAKTIGTVALGAYRGFSSTKTALTSNPDSTSDAAGRLLGKLSALSVNMQKLEDKLLDTLAREFRDKFTEKTDQIFTEISELNEKYDEFTLIYKYRKNYTDSWVKGAAQAVAQPINSKIKSHLGKAYRALLDEGSRNDSLISILLEDSPIQKKMCESGKSAQMLIHDLYELVVTTDAKALLMILRALDIQGDFQDGAFGFEKFMEIRRYNKTVNEAYDKVLSAMRRASTKLWRCDAPNWIEGETYFKFAPVLQIYFVYQTDTVDKMWSAFWTSCEEYKREKLNCHSDPCKAQPASKRCTGNIRDCRFVSRDMQLCHSPEESSRRYDWMMTRKDHEKYGHYTENCPNTQGVGSVINIHTCACTCENEDRLIDRYISLRFEYSDFKNNKVITGVRFKKVNHVLHIQIEQATMGPQGNITDQPEWKPVNGYSDEELLSPEVSVRHREWNGWTDFKRSSKVYTITYDTHTLYLDELTVDPGHVLTGVTFFRLDNAVLLTIHQTPFDYETGKLDYTKYENPFETLKWGQYNDPRRNELGLGEADDPARSGKLDKYTHGNEIVNFRMSDLHSDLGQNMIPYFDLQPVSMARPLPLRGVGIFHKSRENFGGFVSLKTSHYDFSMHVSEDDRLELQAINAQEMNGKK